ncbi:MAG: aminodeoxychorismate synthase component I [Gammaproteobacteria bacterium]|nr:aminodeoxychorismate synthase component I [Gammaproteobacteria bacterium]
MNLVQIVPLPYSLNAPAAFLAVADMPAAVWLDSGQPLAPGGRFDIISADPIATLPLSAGSDNPFVELDDLLCELAPQNSEPQLPFNGGVIGYAGYELGSRENHLPADERFSELPAGFFGLYDWALIIDHQLQVSHLVFHPACTAIQQRELCARFKAVAWHKTVSNHPFELKTPFCHEFTRDEYCARVVRILEYIHAGDIYQANFTQRFYADYQGDPLTAYLALRQRAAGPFSAFMCPPGGKLLSLSPERFIHADRGFLQTEPIKGTAKRSGNLEEDVRQSAALNASVKDRAENLMIVDLLRNDLGKLCQHGSVQVPEFCSLASFANVHHLVSTVTGKLPETCAFTQALAACFPGGSITGAPKRRAMEVIRELELSPRGVYCGNIGYISSCGRADTSIAIRTLTATTSGRLSCAAGGGIVADSTPTAEYQECLDKVALLLEIVEQFQHD